MLGKAIGPDYRTAGKDISLHAINILDDYQLSQDALESVIYKLHLDEHRGLHVLLLLEEWASTS